MTSQAFSIPGLELGPILYTDAVVADSWTGQWGDSSKRPNWEWAELSVRYNAKSAFRRFEVAIRLNGRLLALSYGFPNKSKLILRIHALARAPQGNPLAGRTLPIILFCAEAYAQILSSREIWICDPMNVRVAQLYQTYNFMPVTTGGGEVSHLVKRVT